MSVYTPIVDERLVQSLRAQARTVNVTCADINLRRAARAVTQMYDRFLAASNLQVTQFSLLVACAVAGPAPITNLAEKLVMDRTTLARNLKPLTTRGLVKIANGDDRRVHVVALSDRGYAALAKALPLWQEAQTKIVEGFGQPRLSSLLQDLSALVRLARER